MDKRVSHEFVKRILEESAVELSKTQKAKIYKLLKMRTGNLIKNRSITVNPGNDYMDGELVHTHPVYERFLDMKRRSKNSKLIENRIKSKVKSIRTNGFPIHNQPIMKVYNTMQIKLMYYLTQETIDQIKQELEIL